MLNNKLKKGTTKEKTKTVLGIVIKALLEEVYTDGIDNILSFDIDAGNQIKGIFNDSLKKFNFEISPSGKVSYIESEFGLRQDSFEELIVINISTRNDSTIQKKRCTKGKSCGEGCIARGIKCNEMISQKLRQELPKIQKASQEAKKQNWDEAFQLIGKVAIGLLAVNIIGGVAASAYLAATLQN